jgi:hypothetical protein
MVPESELMNPTLTLLPVVSTQELLALAVELAEAGSDIWLPQPARAVAIAAAVRGIKARLVTATLMITCFSLRAASRQRLVSRVLTGPIGLNLGANCFHRHAASFPHHFRAGFLPRSGAWEQ